MRQWRYVQGFMDMGSVFVPPIPTNFVMTDRQDGTLWHLTHNVDVFSVDGNGYISIKDVLPTTNDLTVYGAYEGPYLQERVITQGERIFRLLIRGGFLGYEVVEEQGLSFILGAPILTSRNMDGLHRQIVTPLSWAHAGDPLGWSTEIINND